MFGSLARPKLPDKLYRFCTESRLQIRHRPCYRDFAEASCQLAMENCSAGISVVVVAIGCGSLVFSKTLVRGIMPLDTDQDEDHEDQNYDGNDDDRHDDDHKNDSTTDSDSYDTRMLSVVIVMVI